MHACGRSGTPADVGHLFPLGNTEEALTWEVLGCRERGTPDQGAFDHSTGLGWVRPREGDYHDAQTEKNNQVVIWVVETSGAVGQAGMGRLVATSRALAADRTARDGTAYGRSRQSPTTYLQHHTQCISKAAVFGEADAILARTPALKRRAYHATTAPALALPAPTDTPDAGAPAPAAAAPRRRAARPRQGRARVCPASCSPRERVRAQQ